MVRSGEGSGNRAGRGTLGIRFAFDYVDPGSYVASRLLDRWMAEIDKGVAVEWKPLELRPPPARRLDAADPRWVELTDEVRTHALRHGLSLPDIRSIPWTRKAHELAYHAREKGCFQAVHRALFEAHFAGERDIGRVDVLVEIGSEHGLEAAETRAVLGIDRFRAAVQACRREVLAVGVRGVPTLWTDGERLEGFRGGSSLREFLERAVKPRS